PPDFIEAMKNSLNEAIEEISLAGYLPLIICSAQIRPYLYRMIHNTYPLVSVVSFTELPADTDIEIHGQVRV
ncbi:MAG TPA: FHIPEP family type III secretion protein, partial [Candidatus Kapabacteria bacterium]|nr:FHIPEP family type III secretion protein [Candidatus Kapabacteria bacterium]